LNTASKVKKLSFNTSPASGIEPAFNHSQSFFSSAAVN